MMNLAQTTTTTKQSPTLRALIAVTLAACSTTALAQKTLPTCPDASLVTDIESSDLASADPDAPIEIESDGFEGARAGEWLLKGNVTVTQGQRRLTTRDAVYNPETNHVSVDNGVEYVDPDLQIRGAGAEFNPAGGATFEGAQFELPAQSARGEAGLISASASGEIALDRVSYTTCPLGNDDWVIRASDIDISRQHGIGTGRGVRLDFKGVPILYTPFFSFPVGNERQSGFLPPMVNNSTDSGISFSVPWYWNIAPNYDATLMPTWYTKRGAKLDTEFRYLDVLGRGLFNAEYLPDDRQYGDARSLLRFTDRSDFTRNLRLTVDAANASDSQWFEDFGLGPEGTSISYLNRSATLVYLNDNWLVSGIAQNFQTIDDTIAATDQPHTTLPQLAAQAWFPQSSFGLTYGFEGEVANFQHDDRIGGTRVDVAPQILMPLRGAGIYLEPAASWRYTAYRLDDVAPGQDDAPTRSAPILSLDGGMAFERNTGSRQQRLITLEPRFKYLYVPYRNQDALASFDTTPADLNLVQLFRTNRYVGADRLSNANQVSFGVTTRLLDADTGRQFIAATVGQAYYFDEPRVALPNETLDDTESSDIVAELDLTAYRDWNIGMGVQWDPGETRSEKGDVNVRYQPEYDQVVNVGYRFRRGSLEQVDGSVAWPIAERWSGYARWVYSLEDKTTVNQFAGLEYRSCCWRARVVAQRYIGNRDGDVKTNVMLQLELTGLSSVGDNADAFLERSIQGYSVRPPEPPSTGAASDVPK